MGDKSARLGTEPITKLLMEQAIPAAIGILTLSINGVVDTIFVGQYIGTLGIAAIAVVLPITFLISSLGMAIGVGGSSVISRALGAENPKKASLTFGNQISLTLGSSILFMVLGYFFQVPLLNLFGGKGDVLPYASTYFGVLLPFVPILAWAMMSNNVIRAVGEPRTAMMVMIIPAILNIILDYVFIVQFNFGMQGAAYATAISYLGSALWALYFFVSSERQLNFEFSKLWLNIPIVKEIVSIGSVTLARQGVVSLLAIVLNNSLFAYGGELSISVWGVINRMLMFANFPVFGVTQGFLPIAGFNFGAKKWLRVKKSIKVSLIMGTCLALLVFAIILTFTDKIVAIFSSDEALIQQTVPALRWVFLATPLITLQLVGSAYFQAIGKAKPALLLTLTKQVFFLIPLLLIIPSYYGLMGIWAAFPIADTASALVTAVFLKIGVDRLGK